MTTVAIDQVRSEWLKSLSLRSSWACIVASVVAVVGLGALQVLTADHPTPGGLGVGSGLGLLIVMAFGVVSATSDVQFGTLRTTRLANPNRGLGYLCKVVSVGLIGSGIGAVSGAIMLAIGGAGADLGVSDAAVLRATLGLCPVYFAAAALSCAVGLVIGRTGLGVAAVIIWVQAIEPLAPALPGIGDAVRAWLPFMNSVMFTNPAQFGDPPRQPLPALGYFYGFCVTVVSLIGLWMRRRDL